LRGVLRKREVCFPFNFRRAQATSARPRKHLFRGEIYHSACLARRERPVRNKGFLCRHLPSCAGCLQPAITALISSGDTMIAILIQSGRGPGTRYCVLACVALLLSGLPRVISFLTVSAFVLHPGCRFCAPAG